MTPAVLDRPGTLFDADTRAPAAPERSGSRPGDERGGGHPSGGAGARRGDPVRGGDLARGGDHVTLEERLTEALRAARTTGSTECPACGGAMTAAGDATAPHAAACGDCGSRLS